MCLKFRKFKEKRAEIVECKFLELIETPTVDIQVPDLNDIPY